jgi:hypothetical protein
MERIFVHIAGQWNNSHQAVLDELFTYAAKPQRISVGFAHDADCALDVPPGMDPAQVRRVHTSPAKSDFGYARAVQLYGYEEYVLSFAEVGRFVPEWDERLLASLAACESEKPVLSGISGEPSRVVHAGCAQADELQLRREALGEGDETPARGAFVGWGDFFARGAIVDEVLRHISAVGSVSNLELSARVFMNGYDVFHPHARLLECPREEIQTVSTSSVRAVIEAGKEDVHFGAKRPFAEFTKLAGVEIEALVS